MVSASNPCAFCTIVEGGRLLLDRGAALAIEDTCPLNPGHALVIPRRHEADFFALSADEITALFGLVAEVRALQIQRHRPDGFNVGVNVGGAGGQTIFHVHIHVIPRYHGDVADPRGGIRWIIPARAPFWR